LNPPKTSRYGRYVNVGPQRTPGGRRSERVTGKFLEFKADGKYRDTLVAKVIEDMTGI